MLDENKSTLLCGLIGIFTFYVPLVFVFIPIVSTLVNSYSILPSQIILLTNDQIFATTSCSISIRQRSLIQEKWLTDGDVTNNTFSVKILFTDDRVNVTYLGQSVLLNKYCISYIDEGLNEDRYSKTAVTFVDKNSNELMRNSDHYPVDLKLMPNFAVPGFLIFIFGGGVGILIVAPPFALYLLLSNLFKTIRKKYKRSEKIELDTLSKDLPR